MAARNRVHKSQDDRMLSGVAGGLAEYFDADPTLVRVLFVVACFMSGVGLLFYIALAVIMPEGASRSHRDGAPEEGRTAEDASEQAPKAPPATTANAARPGDGALAVLLIVIGAVVLATSLNAFSWSIVPFGPAPLWALLLIIIGVVLLSRRTRRA